jgi:hypothetical protein
MAASKVAFYSRQEGKATDSLLTNQAIQGRAVDLHGLVFPQVTLGLYEHQQTYRYHSWPTSRHKIFLAKETIFWISETFSINPWRILLWGSRSSHPQNIAVLQTVDGVVVRARQTKAEDCYRIEKINHLFRPMMRQ